MKWRAEAQPRARRFSSHRWKLGWGLLAVFVLWSRRRRRRRPSVEPVSERWLAEHEVETGRRPES